jgi:hypothetical protein
VHKLSFQRRRGCTVELLQKRCGRRRGRGGACARSGHASARAKSTGKLTRMRGCCKRWGGRDPPRACKTRPLERNSVARANRADRCSRGRTARCGGRALLQHGKAAPRGRCLATRLGQPLTCMRDCTARRSRFETLRVCKSERLCCGPAALPGRAGACGCRGQRGVKSDVNKLSNAAHMKPALF